MKMRNFSKVSPKLWRSRRFREQTDDARMLHIFLLTCEQQTSAGCLRLPDAYTAADLVWDAKKLSHARASLIEADLIVHDETTDEYVIRRWFKHNPANIAKHRQGIERLMSEVESDSVREAANNEFEEQQTNRNPLDDPPSAMTSGPGGSRLTDTNLKGRR